MSENIIWLSGLSKAQTSLVGQKAQNLGKLYSSKIPTPQAFTITTKALASFLEQSKILQTIKDILNKTNQNNIEEKSKEIQDLIIKTPFPQKLESEILEAYDHFNINLSELKDSPGALAILKSAREPIFVAIRQSPISNAKPYSIINIKGNNEIIEKIKESIAKNFSKESIEEYKKSNSENPIQSAIIIQKMINSEKTGVIFSKNPTEHDQSVLIKSTFGQKITAEITPDEYILSKDFDILKEKISEKKFAIARTASGQTKTITLKQEESQKRSLKTYELKQLAEISSKLEEIFESPQETKFAIENRSIYILNSKPISNLQFQQTSKEEFLPAEPTKTKIKTIIDAALFEEKIKTINPKDIIIKLENLISSYYKTQEQQSPEEYKNFLKEKIIKIIKTFEETTKWIFLPNINEEEMSLTIQAIKESVPQDNIKIILSGVNTPKQITKTEKLLEKIGIPNSHLGISLETPAAAILIKDICQTKIKLVSFDTKNLAKYTLANENSADETSWAILKQISRVIRECKNQKVETSIHNSSITNTKLLEFIIKQKIDSISLTPTQTHEVSKLIQKIELENQIEPIDNKKEIAEKIEELEEENSKKENIFD